MKLPNFIHVGQPKAGSTALHFALHQNPAVCLVKSKEAHFFDTPAFDQGLDHYRSHFEHHTGQPIIGDITPAYCLPQALQRIAASIPDAKITVCFRHPVSRSWSHYFHSVRDLGAVGPVLEDLRLYDDYVRPGLGGLTLQTLYDHFPRKNILPLVYERDFRDINIAYRRVCDFLGIPAHPINAEKMAGRGFVPVVTRPRFWGIARDWRGPHRYRPGDVVIETMRDSQIYEIIVEPGERTAYRRPFEHVTWSLDHDGITTAWRHFSEDAELLKSLLGDALPEWDLVTSLKAPPRVPSRIGLAATLRELRH